MIFKCDMLALALLRIQIRPPSSSALRQNYPKILTKTSIPCKFLLSNSSQTIPSKKSSQKKPPKKILPKHFSQKIPPNKFLQKNSPKKLPKNSQKSKKIPKKFSKDF